MTENFIMKLSNLFIQIKNDITKIKDHIETWLESTSSSVVVEAVLETHFPEEFI